MSQIENTSSGRVTSQRFHSARRDDLHGSKAAQRGGHCRLPSAAAADGEAPPNRHTSTL